jgi:hypothetical protein
MTLRDKLVKIGAKVVWHGRYVTFQLAEVAIPLPLFAEILQLIAGLRPRPAARTNDQATYMPFVCRSDRLILGDRAAVGKPGPT